jgi:hypothetical protein
VSRTEEILEESRQKDMAESHEQNEMPPVFDAKLDEEKA